MNTTNGQITVRPRSGNSFARHAFLRALNKRHQMILAAAAQPFEAKPGELLAKEGEAADRFLLIQSGHATLGIDTPESGFIPLETIGRGDVVGWSWLVPPHRWQFECRAVGDVRGLSLDGQWLREKCEQDHELGYYLLKELLAVIAGRLAATRRQLTKIYK
jgi:CRP-like cAMP-binding protein